MGKNRICPVCGKKFHACSSCSLTYYWEYEYCSKDCAMASTEYKQCERILDELSGGDVKLIDEHGDLFDLAVIEQIEKRKKANLWQMREECEQ